ncbi:MAG: protoporphyrinogen oxidase-like protein [Candidatus Dadabacteria bacterium]|nr:protoporphyrinogen oxidase-like protein [Candidatus Dadabacteria bacterium]
MVSADNTLIIGGGVTGLAAGLVSKHQIYESKQVPGGICSSYYLKPGQTEPIFSVPEDEEVYRFEIGGGHWIFGGDPIILDFIRSLTPVKKYGRSSAVYFPDDELYVPYPLQNNLAYLGKDIASKAINEMISAPKRIPKTMEEWLEICFGKTLVEKFFAPFHELYTAGLWTTIAPQDAYKSPVNINAVIQGAFEQKPPEAGYNITYLYPERGLNDLAAKMADKCNINYGKKIVEINTQKKEVFFENGDGSKYEKIISTLPLNKALEVSNLNQLDEEPDSYSSVLVLNIGGVRGKKCPNEHWLYIPYSKSGFHRVGFYSNVDRSFMPKSAREENSKVSIYIERAYKNGEKPSDKAIKEYSNSVVEELKTWGFITEAETVHPTWIDVAYTWANRDSNWKNLAMSELEKNNIYQIGRYGRWIFQGIADSIKDGFFIGGALG